MSARWTIKSMLGLTAILAIAACGGPSAFAPVSDSMHATAPPTSQIGPVSLVAMSVSGAEDWSSVPAGEFPQTYPWSLEEQQLRRAAIEQRDATLLPQCSNDYIAWRDEAKQRGLLQAGPPDLDFWSSPGCKGVPDRLVQGPPSGLGPVVAH